jgi:pyruvate formate lyase activating enzyme
VYASRCTHCSYCISACPLHAIRLVRGSLLVDRDLCDNCGKCSEVCYPEAIKLLGQYMTTQELLAEVRKDAIIYKHSGGGVTISGGEPLFELKFTKSFLKGCKEEGISVGVDTCGHISWSHIEQTAMYIDFFLWDIKHMNPEIHQALTGVANELVLSNARRVSDNGIPIYLRIPVIPGYNDSEQNIRATCEFATSLRSLVEVHLLPLHHLGSARYESIGRPYPVADVPLITDYEMQALKVLVESYGLECRIGG